MISEIIIPDLGASGGDVILEEWLVKPGQAVRTGQPLFLVTTDKATVEVEAFRDGVIRELRAEVGSQLAPGSIVAVLADDIDEPIPAEMADQSKAHDTLNVISPSPLRPRESVSQKPGQRIMASPLARKIAEKEGIDLTSLTGTGTQGQILKRDVQAVIDSQLSASGALPPITGLQRQALSPMRRSIAEITSRSKSEIPHFYTTITIDMQAALNHQQQMVELADLQDLPEPTITDICLRAAALTLVKYPDLNASFDGETVTTYPEINIGLVIGLEEGMLVPVIHKASDLDIFATAAATRQVKNKALSGQLSADQLSSATFTLSNLGMFGVDSFTAVINPPQVAILALGAVKEQPAAIDGVLVPRPLMIATLSVDHRVVDGINAARFLESFKEKLEKPLSLMPDFTEGSLP